MNTNLDNPTFAYFRTMKGNGEVRAICCFVQYKDEIVYAWLVRSEKDHDNRRTWAKRKLIARLDAALEYMPGYDGPEDNRHVHHRSFRDYNGKPGQENGAVVVVKACAFDMIGREDNSKVFRTGLDRVRNAIGMFERMISRDWPSLHYNSSGRLVTADVTRSVKRPSEGTS